MQFLVFVRTMTGDFTTGTALHPADWYVDPWVADQLRYWDGQA